MLESLLFAESNDRLSILTPGVPQGLVGTLPQVLLGTAPRQDTLNRVWAVRR